jgi:hypothetical protein
LTKITGFKGLYYNFNRIKQYYILGTIILAECSLNWRSTNSISRLRNNSAKVRITRANDMHNFVKGKNKSMRTCECYFLYKRAIFHTKHASCRPPTKLFTTIWGRKNSVFKWIWKNKQINGTKGTEIYGQVYWAITYLYTVQRLLCLWLWDSYDHCLWTKCKLFESVWQLKDK